MKYIIQNWTKGIFTVALCLALIPSQLSADKLCLKKRVKVSRSGTVNLSKSLKAAATCGRGTVEVIDSATYQGPPGANGVDGANGADGADGVDGVDGSDGASGSLGVYGDGSDGDLTISANTPLSLSSLDLQYDDIVIDPGVTWTVPSGTSIRCTGTLTVNGIISVSTGLPGGRVGSPPSFDYTDQPYPKYTYALPGIGASIPHPGLTSLGSTTALSTSLTVGAGRGASAFFQIGSLLRATPYGGGAGGGGTSTSGGAGGGRFNALCQGAIVIAATGIVSANAGFGGNGAGGGGGGVIVLASGTSISNAGLVMALGGDGGNGTTGTAPGGGGGGGFVAMIAPSVASPGIESVDAGLTGVTAGDINSTPRTSGANGGASYGNGGRGGDVPAGGVATPTNGTNGVIGLVSTKVADPAALFM